MTKHIVDTLLEERAPKLTHSPIWPILRPIVKILVRYENAKALTDTLSKLNGQETIAHMARLLNLQYCESGFENLPKSGPVIVVANHPSGIADGIALIDVLHKYRPDLKFFGNADAIKICAGLRENLVPIEWTYANRRLSKTRKTLEEAASVLNNGMILGTFPAGRVSRMIDGRIQDPKWSHSFITLARKFNVPNLPISLKS